MSDIKHPRTFVVDEDRQNWMQSIRQKIREQNDSVVCRINGLSGIGKTRFVFEALNQDDLKCRVIYANAEQFRSSNLFYSLQNDPNSSGILVIDECDLEHHEMYVRSFSGRGARFALLTLSYETGGTPLPTSTYQLKPLSQEKIKELIKNETQQLPDHVVDRLSVFADGYPRIAALLVESYLTSKGSTEEFWNITDEGLMNRLVGGREPTTGEHFKKTARVLWALSLFEKVGYRGSLSVETEWIAEFVEISYSDFDEIVGEQRKRGIVQGVHYIYVTPFILRVFLFREWWQLRGFTKEKFVEFIQCIPEDFRTDLLERFMDHVPYIADVEAGRDFVDGVLGEQGIFMDGSLLRTKVGASFFLKLAEAHPESALNCLRRTVGKWDKEQLLQFTTGRREVVWALERTAMWRALFADSARVLMLLAEAENENFSTNASGVFAALFSNAPGRVAPTEATPAARFPVLQEALESDSKEKRLIGLRACEEALESQHFTRMIGSEFQGLRHEPKLWYPKTYGELYDAYRRVWNLLTHKLESMTPDEIAKTNEMIFQKSYGLLYILNLKEMIIETFHSFSTKPFITRKELLAHLVKLIVHARRNLPLEVTEALEDLEKNLCGEDFSSRLRRYVGLSLIEDEIDKHGKYDKNKKSRTAARLAKESLLNLEIFHSEMEWLVTTEAENGYQFGYELGRLDTSSSLLGRILEVQVGSSENRSISFLAGYFKAIFEANPDLWEDRLDLFSQDSQLAEFLPELVWRSGLTDRAALMILRMARARKIDVRAFGLFGSGGVIGHLSEPVFGDWLEFLLGESGSDAVSIALNLCGFYYADDDLPREIPKEMALRLLTHPSLFENFDFGKHHPLTDHFWTKIGVRFVDEFPLESVELADTILAHLGDEKSVLRGFYSETQKVICRIFTKNPEAGWKKVCRYIGPPIDGKAYHITTWLRGGRYIIPREGGLSLVPLSDVFEWVDIDVEHRAWYLASFVPNKLTLDNDGQCLAREVLIRYGNREDVRRNFSANYSSEGWSGADSLHCENKKKHLSALKKAETNYNVITWIDEYIAELDSRIERANVQEERRGY